MSNQLLTLKRNILNLCDNQKRKKKSKKLISLYKEMVNIRDSKQSPSKKVICRDLVFKELANTHSNLGDRLFLIYQIMSGIIPISNKRITYPLSLKWNPISKVNMLETENTPDDILNFFENSPDHQCLFLNDCLGKMSYPFCLSFEKIPVKLSLKIGYFKKKIIKKHPHNLSLIKNRNKIRSHLKKKHDLSSDNPVITQFYTQYMISENMNNIKKKVLTNLKLSRKKELTQKDLLNKYVNLESKLPLNVENRIVYLLSELVFNKYTPHINLPIFSFRTSFSKLKLNLDLYPLIKEDIHQKKILNNVSILVSEWCSLGNLSTFLRQESNLFRENHHYWDILLFQLVYTLTIIQTKYPSFRHNDLHLKNILVQKTNSHHSENYLYHLKLHGQELHYIIPDIGFQIRFWDYDWSSIHGLVDNRKAISKDRHLQNRTFDLFTSVYLLEKLYEKTMTGKMNSEHLSFFTDVKKGITEKEMGLKKKHLLCVNQEFEIPENILLKHSDSSYSRAIFKQFLSNEDQIQHMNFCDKYKFP